MTAMPNPSTIIPDLWTNEDAAAAINGTNKGSPWSACGVSIDSRTVKPGDLFVALKGPNFDGHQFVKDALNKGAAAAIVDHDIEGASPLLICEDTFTALQDLGRVGRLRSDAKIIAVTGSVGKTTTKSLLGESLKQQGACYATTGSLNNHWGVPLSLANMPQNTQFGVFELGMNHAGEIEQLTRLVQPHVAIITKIAPVHTEFFDTLEDIASAKAEIFLSMTAGDIAILNGDDPFLAQLTAAARTQGIGRILRFGTHTNAEARLLEIGNVTKIAIMGEQITFRPKVTASHWIMNAMAVLLAVKAVGGDIGSAAHMLEQIQPLPGRGETTTIDFGDGQITLIDESYNASPDSMKAAFNVLGSLPARRHVAVLGDMLEMGKMSQTYHEALAAPIKDADIDLVFCCGKEMKALYETLPPDLRGAWAETSDELLPIIKRSLKAGDAVVIKGSNGMKMKKIVDSIHKFSDDGQSL